MLHHPIAGAGFIEKVPSLYAVLLSSPRSYSPVCNFLVSVVYSDLHIKCGRDTQESTKSLFVAERASSRVQSNSVDGCRPPDAGCRDSSTDMTEETRIEQIEQIDLPEDSDWNGLV